MGANDTARVIGGVFGFGDIENDGGTSPQFLSENCALLANARSGVWLVATLLKPPRVWLPSFLCHTILDGVRAAGMEARFYAVDENLRVPTLDWAEDVGSGDLVVIIDYFGWPSDLSCKALMHQKGAYVLEDACQAMLTEGIGQGSDFLLVSPRKFLGVPDGAVLQSNCSEVDLRKIPLTAPPQAWWLDSFAAMMLRREFDLYGNNRAWYDLYRRFDAQHPIGPYAMSQLSHGLILRKIDYVATAKRRINNYQFLVDRLDQFALFAQLPAGVVPLGFPVRLKERDRLRQALFSLGIYPPVHWQIAGVVPPLFTQSHRLSAEIMTLPCDQRYDDTDMNRMVSGLLKESPS